MLEVIDVLIYEDNKALREALKDLLSRTNDFKVSGAFADCTQVEAQVKKLQPDVILMDIDMPGVNGIQGVQMIRRFSVDVHILMLTIFDSNDKVFDALRAGASGYLLKKTPPSKIIEAIKEVTNGGAPMSPEIAKKVLQHFNDHPVKVENKYNLTAREKDILFCLTQGCSYTMAAEQFQLSIDTIRFT